MWQQEIGVFAVRFAEQADEFTHHLSVELGDHGFTTASGSDGTTPIEFGPPTSGAVDSVLLISPVDTEQVVCVVQGEGDAVKDEHVEPWRRAAADAAAALGRRNRPVPFEALVGPIEHHFSYPPGQLARAHQLGPVLLTPGQVHLRDYLVGGDRLPRGQMLRYSFPVVMSASIMTYDWRAALLTAEWVLRRTCALLTLATGWLWSPRSSPTERTDHAPGLQAPATAGKPLESWPEDDWTGEIPGDAPTFELGAWTERAWQLLDEDSALAEAIDAHYEAVRLQVDGYASTAHLMFVAAIEGYGVRLVEEGPCTSHPDCPHPRAVSTKRFRKALKTVMSNSQVDKLATDAYDRRSRTGHTGALLGSERTFGNPGFHLSGVTGTFIFDGPMVSEMRSACRRVLLNALGAPAPGYPRDR